MADRPFPLVTLENYATLEYLFTSFIRRSPSSSAVISRSYWDCKPSQNSDDVPKNRASLRAVSAVIFLFSRTISFILRGGTPIFIASLFWLKPIGFRNSSRRTSVEDQAYVAEVPELPGCVADGKTYQKALSNIEVIIQEWIETAYVFDNILPLRVRSLREI